MPLSTLTTEVERSRADTAQPDMTERRLIQKTAVKRNHLNPEPESSRGGLLGCKGEQMGSTTISLHASKDATPRVFFLSDTESFSVGINDQNDVNVVFFVNRAQLDALRSALDMAAAEQDGTRDA